MNFIIGTKLVWVLVIAHLFRGLRETHNFVISLVQILQVITTSMRTDVTHLVLGIIKSLGQIFVC